MKTKQTILIKEFIKWFQPVDADANGKINDEEWGKKYKETSMWDLIEKKLEKLFSKALDEQKEEMIEKIGKKRHYDLEEYDHDDKMMSVGYNQALDDIIKKIKEL